MSEFEKIFLDAFDAAEQAERVDRENSVANVAYNVDCMEFMKSVPDKYFDLAVVDPPYGGGASNTHTHTSGLCGGNADFENRKRSRFGGLFDKYHINNENRRELEQEIPAERGYL